MLKLSFEKSMAKEKARGGTEEERQGDWETYGRVQTLLKNLHSNIAQKWGGMAINDGEPTHPVASRRAFSQLLVAGSSVMGKC
jgi:hypothetical protein